MPISGLGNGSRRKIWGEANFGKWDLVHLHTQPSIFFPLLRSGLSPFAAPSLSPILGTMERDSVGDPAPRAQMEAHANWDSPTDREHIMDGFVHHHLEAIMNEYKVRRSQCGEHSYSYKKQRYGQRG